MSRKILYTTGAYITPVKTDSGKWMWAVSSFEENTFDESNVFNPEFIACDDVDILENTQEDISWTTLEEDNANL